MQFPTRELTRPEFDLVLAIRQVLSAKWYPITRDADKAADEAGKIAGQIKAAVKASPEYQEHQRLLNGPSVELGEHFRTLGNGNIETGCLLFQKAGHDAEAPWHEADKRVWDASEHHQQMQNDYRDDQERTIALTFLRLGYKAGVQDALNVATNPTGIAAMLQFMRDVMDDSPATDTLLAAAVDKFLATPAMAAVIGGER